MDEVKIKSQLFVRETCGSDESQMTKEDVNLATASRRVLLNRQPDN